MTKLTETKLTENFTLEELCHTDHNISNELPEGPEGEQIKKNLTALCANILQPLRDSLSQDITVNSGFRSKGLNKRIKGSSTSQHMSGMAADIECLTLGNNLKLAQMIEEKYEFDQLILEYYDEKIENSGWVHVSYKRRGRNRMEKRTKKHGIKGYPLVQSFLPQDPLKDYLPDKHKLKSSVNTAESLKKNQAVAAPVGREASVIAESLKKNQTVADGNKEKNVQKQDATKSNLAIDSAIATNKSDKKNGTQQPASNKKRTPGQTTLTENFTLEEFCRTTHRISNELPNGPKGEQIKRNLKALCEKILQPLRDSLGKAINITSGFISEELNKKVRGLRNSQHMSGMAANIECPSLGNNLKLAQMIEKNYTFDRLILGDYDKKIKNSGWVHVSYREGNNRGEKLRKDRGKRPKSVRSFLLDKQKVKSSLNAAEALENSQDTDKLKLALKVFNYVVDLVKDGFDSVKEFFESGANLKTIEILEKHKFAFLKGKQKWESDGSGEYNNIHVPKKSEETDNKYIKVYRRYYMKKGIYRLVSSHKINETQYKNFGLGLENATYCNIAINEFAIQHGATNLMRLYDKEKKKYKDQGANDMYTNLEEGCYNNNNGKYRNVSWEKAEEYASRGGFALATWKNPTGRSGHIATLTGGYKNNKKSLENLNIFQAGGTFGHKTISSGFPKRNRLKFYIWEKKPS